MKLNARYLIVLSIILLTEYHAFQTINTWSKTFKPSIRMATMALYVILSIGFYVFMTMFRNMDAHRSVKAFCTVVLFAFVLAKVVMACVLFIDDIKRIGFYISSLFFAKKEVPAVVENGISRSAFLQKTALLAGGTMFAMVLYGSNNRYKYKLRTLEVPFTNLPTVFKGLKIIQISDVHSGSFTDVKAVNKGIDMILAQQPDIIFFTGDLVNNVSTEMHDYIETFARLKAPMGVFSILGNHDYGDYAEWESREAKAKNLDDLKAIHKQLGWDLLLDENRIITLQGEKLAIIGVQNISGSKGFHTYGNLEKAYKGVENIEHKILLSHDPSHWDAEVNNSNKNIQLTLSGHTHGMQFGLELPFIKWSPIKYMYKQWAGLYTENNTHLYVNRGFGFLGYPGRIGIMPEITLIHLT